MELSITNFMRFLAGSLLSCALLTAVTAVQLDLIGRRVGRDDVGQFGNGSHALSNVHDFVYPTDITVGGRVFNVEVDTGSTDLWIVGDVPGALNVSNPAPVSIQYGAGQVSGFINTVEVQFDGFTIQDQAFLNTFDVQDPGLEMDGILGLGPSAFSEMKAAVQGDSRADPVIDGIFQENPNTPNFGTLGVNVSFFFGGNKYPVSPLGDLIVDLKDKDVNDQDYKQTVDKIAQNQDSFGAADMILGPSFLRNVYMPLNYGNFIDGSTSNVAPPFIKLLSVMDKNQMHQDFVNARLNGGQSSTGNARPADPGTSGHDDKGSPSHLPGILGLSLGLSVLVYMLGF
ncbi:hypothetical protein D9758_002625 [Tetrapyrgos nigripes]|uniref:Peptidase A1 domain-containing protein n=1 Tax=Tetrapyrgos nigripes TaxID=182062 RepID=A0A8H5LTX7_9AGAR|nr:hypothetical protein D9758_002625 [Tetrapyrgos nigripes]